MLLGVLTPTAGRITVLGEDMLRHRHRVLPRMNFTSPYVDLPKRLTVGENLRVFADLYGVRHARERIAAVAEDCDLAGAAEAAVRRICRQDSARACRSPRRC